MPQSTSYDSPRDNVASAETSRRSSRALAGRVITTWQENKAARSRAYGEKLKDPRWQKMRLQVLARDQWCCQLCFNSEATLHIHHFYYEAGKEPWDYPHEAFTTLCESCHAEEGEDRPQEEKALLLQLKKKGFMAWDLSKLAEGFASFPDGLVWMPVPDMIAFTLSDSEMRQTMREAYFAHLAAMRDQREANSAEVEAERD